MIDQATIDRIFDTAKIEEVVGDYVTLKRRGANLIGNCPFHNEKTPSFSVSPAKNIYKCFGCGEGGNPVNFIMKIENLSYYEALKFIAQKYHIEIVEKELSEEQLQQRGERESLMAVTEALQQQFTKNLFEHPEGTSVGLSYFRHRGFHDDIIRRFQLGYALNQRDAYTNDILKKGYKLEYLEKIGATIVKEKYNIDRFHGRAIFPIHSISGKVIAFGGRAIKKDEQVKYQNSPESDIYHKSNVLYGIFFAKNAIVREKKCYLVEGYADVISMFQSGIENIVAPCGTALTVEQIRLLSRILPSVDSGRGGAKNVTMLYDGDSAGLNAALKNGKLLLEEGLNVRVVVLPEGDDPDTFAQNNDSTVIRDFLEKNEKDYIFFKIDYYLSIIGNDPMKKAQLISEIADTLAVISDNVKLSVYTRECAKLLDTEEKLIFSEISKTRKNKAEKEWKINYTKQTISHQTSNQQSSGQSVTIEKQPDVSLRSSKDPLEAEERNIVYFFVKYGDVIIIDDDEGRLNVAEFIHSELEVDDLKFSNKLYQSMLEEFVSNIASINVTSERFFTYHKNPEFSRVASDVLSEQYTLSKMFDKNVEDCKIKVKKVEVEEKDRLTDLIPHVLLDYKFKWLSLEVKKKILSLKDVEDPTKVVALMSEIQDLKRCVNEMAKSLGERIIVK
jgi:DNA primase